MVFDAPGHLVAHIGPQHGGGHHVVVERGKAIADVVQQRGDHPVDIRPIAPCPGGALQAMGEAADAIAAIAFVLLRRQGRQHAVGNAGQKGAFEFAQQQVIGTRALLHRGEGDEWAGGIDHLKPLQIANSRIAS